MSILSELPDGMGFHYGFRQDDYRQINVRFEPKHALAKTGCVWQVYVGGEHIGASTDKGGAERMALEWMDRHPEPANDNSEEDACEL